MFTFGRYKPRDTLAQRFDPRARLIYALSFLISVLMIWDLRILCGFVLLAIVSVVSARVQWAETRRLWFTIVGFISFYAVLTLLTSRAGVEMLGTERVIAQLEVPVPFTTWRPLITLSIEQSMYALSQLVRMASIAIVTVTIPYTINPSYFGVTFRRLGMPDKLAFALDLTMRFVPSLSRDFALTMDAQKARGYELERREGGLFNQIRKLAPLLVPVVIHSIVSGEEVTDAMDLRAFGTRPRTWLRELHYGKQDYMLLGFSALMLLASITAALLGVGRLWAP